MAPGASGDGPAEHALPCRAHRRMPLASWSVPPCRAAAARDGRRSACLPRRGRRATSAHRRGLRSSAGTHAAPPGRPVVRHLRQAKLCACPLAGPGRGGLPPALRPAHPGQAGLDPDGPGRSTVETSFASSSEALGETEALHAQLNYRHGALRQRAAGGDAVEPGEYRALQHAFTAIGATGDAFRVMLLPGAAAVFSLAEYRRALGLIDFSRWHRIRLLAAHAGRRVGQPVCGWADSIRSVVRHRPRQAGVSRDTDRGHRSRREKKAARSRRARTTCRGIRCSANRLTSRRNRRRSSAPGAPAEQLWRSGQRRIPQNRGCVLAKGIDDRLRWRRTWTSRHSRTSPRYRSVGGRGQCIRCDRRR